MGEGLAGWVGAQRAARTAGPARRRTAKLQHRPLRTASTVSSHWLATLLPDTHCRIQTFRLGDAAPEPAGCPTILGCEKASFTWRGLLSIGSLK